MQNSSHSDYMLHLLCDTISAIVRSDGADLSARQLAVFLTCYLRDEGGHTVRGLSESLNVSKPAITRALDRLEELDLARRRGDPFDRRSVVVQKTMRGEAYIKNLRKVMEQAEKWNGKKNRGKGGDQASRCVIPFT